MSLSFSRKANTWIKTDNLLILHQNSMPTIYCLSTMFTFLLPSYCHTCTGQFLSNLCQLFRTKACICKILQSICQNRLIFTCLLLWDNLKCVIQVQFNIVISDKWGQHLPSFKRTTRIHNIKYQLFPYERLVFLDATNYLTHLYIFWK